MKKIMLGTFFTITPENITTLLGYSKDLISDFTPLLLPIIGVAVGIWIFHAVVNSVKK